MSRRIAKISIAILLGVAAYVWVLSRTNRPELLRQYFRLENAWIEHWPTQSGKLKIEKFSNILLRAGMLAPARVEIEPGLSLMLDPRDLVPLVILRTGIWEPELWSSISATLPEGGVFLDVGAHIGYFSVKAARKVGKTGRVVAFEPNPETLNLLRDNVSANRAENVVVEPIACTDREQMLTLFAAAFFNTGRASLGRQNADFSRDGPPKEYTVRGRPIDDVVRELNLTRVDVIKIDVEGAEVFVVKGAMNTLKRFHPKLIVEVIPAQLASLKSTPEDLIAAIKAAGYNHSRPINPEKIDWEWTVQAPR